MIDINNSELLIGPLRFTHVVQKIAIQERKGVSVMETARTSKNLIVDSGESEHKLQVRLLFTGLDEINRGIGTESSGLRGLLALFKCCPITSCRNEYISTTWEEPNKDILLNNGVENFDPNLTVNFYSNFIPIAIESIQLDNVPDLPLAIQATVVIARVDVTAIFENNQIRYCGNSGLQQQDLVDPRQAIWLKKWIEQLLSNSYIPELSEQDFESARFRWYGSDSLGTKLETDVKNENYLNFNLDLTTNTDSKAILLSESSFIRHKFAYNKLLGKTVPFPMHMGSTARSLSLDIVFNNQNGNEVYESFCRFKENAERIAKSTNRIERVTGWFLSTPISKLLGSYRDASNTLNEIPGSGVYVPYSIFLENGDEPDMINCKVDLYENNVDFFSENAIQMISGGTDYDGLKKYYDVVLQKEYAFRLRLRDKNQSATIASELSGQTNNSEEYEMYRLFWPIDKNVLKFNNEFKLGILNIDTLRAVFLDKKFDTNSELRDALLGSKLATGQVVIPSDRRLTFYDKLTAEYPIYSSLFFGVDIGDIEIARIYKAVTELVKTKFVNTTDETLIKKISINLTNGFLGDRTVGVTRTRSYTGEILDIINKSNLSFHEEFKEKLFNVIVERKPKIANLPYVYSTDGVYAAFYKLINKYLLEVDSTIVTEETLRRDILDQTSNKRINSTYPDLLLPTYEELYGPDEWQNFAPTVDDLGIENYEEQENDADRQKLLAVVGEDVVSPACWFYIKRAKPGPEGLTAFSKKIADTVNNISNSFSLSLPFNTSDIETIKKVLNADQSLQNNPNMGKDTLDEIILKALEQHETRNKEGYREDLLSLDLTYGEKFANKYYGELSLDKKPTTIKLYVHNNGNYLLPREVTIPGLGAEIYRVASKYKKLDAINKLPKLDADEQLTTPLQKEVKYHRHMQDVTNKTIQSVLNQIPDDQYSAERMFPAIKVYLIDRRGNDVIADDSLFSVTSIVSVDITLDKDDADLAVIKLADPLYTLQSDYFSSSNIVNADENQGQTKRVLNTLRGIDEESFLKRYKLAQGRSIQIRMGYSSMAYNLPIVFTGRITEILPGDGLTIVAQGWKAELINRQVNFYNDNPKNWGARDLAIQTITNANPEGFGDFYPEYDAQFILRNINNMDVQNMLTQVLENNRGVDLDSKGTRGITDSIVNYLSVALGFSSSDKKNIGFDTRLKNIWYPDTAQYNNIFGLSRTLGTMPSFINDSWVIPLQPAWDVLKEAGRHAWNCVVQVLPYDTQATLFMGHPDQMYYYTKGLSLARSRWNKYNNKKNRNIDKDINNLFELFKNSKFYLSSPNLFNPELIGIPGGTGYVPISATQVQSYLDYINLITKRPVLRALIKFNGLAYQRLAELKKAGMYEYTSLYLFSKFFGVPKEILLTRFNSIEKDLEEILLQDNIPSSVMQKLEALNNTNATPASARKIAELIQSTYNTFYEPNTSDGSAYGIRVRQSNNRTLLIGNLKEAIKELDAIYDVNQENLISTIKTLCQYIINLNKNRSTVVDNPVASTPNPILEELKADDGPLDRVLNLSRQLVTNIENGSYFPDSFLKESGLTFDKNVAQNVSNYAYLFRAFVYYFCSFCLESEEAQTVVANIEDATASKLPSNLRTFRLHHFVSDTSNIIKNNIVASTKEMWNTVVIEHPAPGAAESTVETSEELYSQGRINAGANWVYYPKQEVTGVIGLQFNPGLTLSNKKIKVFTELNCQSPDLAAKLACEHLAQGVKKMYRGTLYILGKHVKPYDRLILADAYTKMTGPVEVDSVIHHWNTEDGWVTNVAPAAVCDANPGAGILQTAIMETTYQAVFNVLDFVSDAAIVATIIATFGAATPLAAGEFTVSKGLSGIAKRFLESKGLGTFIVNTAKANIENVKLLGKSTVQGLNGILKRGHRLDLLRLLYGNFAGPATSLLKNELYIAGAEYATHLFFKSNVIPSFVESTNDMEQLPIILSPIIYNGIPFTAGLGTEDAVWGLSAFGIYYSAKEFQAGLTRYINDIFEDL